jgi:transcriptional regulator with XRE-family HTH domain
VSETPARLSTVQQRRLARILRGLREGADLTIDQVAEKLELSPSTISRIETAQVGVRPRDVRALLDIYEVSEGQRDELLELARKSRHHPWWYEYRLVPDTTVVGFEDDAAYIRQFSALVVPGVLQTSEYASAVIRAIRHDAAAEEIEQRLELRMHRQELLTRKGAPDLWVVLDEPTVLRPVGGPAVMRGQLQRLIEVSALPNVTLQMLPLSVGPHAGMDGEFTIFSFSDPADPDLVFIENSGGDLYLERPDRTQRYRLIFSHLQAAALNPAESVRALADVQQQLPEPERG